MKKHIVIVGGGLTGLSAAYTLAENQYTIKLLEARDRLGGRVKTIHIDGSAVDMGGFIIYP